MARSPRQERNQPGSGEVPAVPPGGGTSYGYALNEGLREAQAAFNMAAADNTARQGEARSWMEAPLQAPTVSGDRQPPKQSHAGHVGEVFGQGVAPGAAPPLLPEAQRNPRLPDPPPPPAPVTASSTRPKGFAGFVFNQHQTTRPTSPANVTYVSVDIPGGRGGGLLAAIRRLFGGAK